MRGFAAAVRAAGCGRVLEERHIPAVRLEIVIGDVVVRTDAAIAAVSGDPAPCEGHDDRSWC